MAEQLLHENWEDLAYFARALNDELYLKNGLIKQSNITLSPTLSEALRQFMIEVDYFGAGASKYGGATTQLGLGLSHMDARTWFNDTEVRSKWSNAIADVYEAYHKAVKEDETAVNEVSAELKAMEAKLDAALSQLAKLKEADPDAAMAAAEKKEEEAETDEEKAEREKAEAEAKKE